MAGSEQQVIETIPQVPERRAVGLEITVGHEGSWVPGKKPPSGGRAMRASRS